MNRDTLKESLIKIKENKMTIPEGINKKELIQSMLRYIGDPDPVLRDELIYEVFIDFIMEKKLSDNEVSELVPVLLDNDHLFKGVDEIKEVDVFTRTFSVLTLPLILYRHREKGGFLSEDVFNKIYEQIMRYSREEKDLRGFVPSYGWAHSVAHTADALDELAACHEIDQDKLIDIMAVIKKKSSEWSIGYVFGEEERLTTTVMSIYKRKLLPESYFVDWVKDFGDLELPSQQPESMYIKNNVRSFLSGLYFRMLDYNSETAITESIKDTLKKCSPFY